MPGAAGPPPVAAVPGLDGKVVKVKMVEPGFFEVEVNDPKHPEYGRINLIFEKSASAPAGLLLRGWVALDAQNNRTTIRLSGQRFNVPISDGTFRFNDPSPAGARK